MLRDLRRESGFTLVETIVATGLLAGALVSLAQILALSVSTNRASRAGTDATILAQQMIEQLIADTTADTTDYVDDRGTSLGPEAGPPPAAVYARRATVAPLPGSPNTVVIQVVVTAVASQRPNGGSSPRRASDEVRLATITTRKAR